MIKLSQEFTTNSGWKGVVIEVINNQKVKVLWQDGSVSEETTSHIKNKSIKPLYQPILAGVGYFGAGKYVPLTKKGLHAPKYYYQYWKRMIVRCYSEFELSKEKGKSYEKVEVSDDWKCFNIFASWIEKQKNNNLSWDLNKDLHGDGLIYSEEKCTFLPKEINKALIEDKNKNSDLPTGVTLLQPRTKGAKIGHVARCHNEKGRQYLGYFESSEEAFKIYSETKEKYFKYLANKYKNILPEKDYEALYNRKVK